MAKSRPKALVQQLMLRFRKLAQGICGYAIAIKKTPYGELGMTTRNPEIYLGFDHELLLKLPIPSYVKMLEGLFAHEIMHKLLSNFDAIASGAEKYKKESGFAARIFCEINNILEDGYIEFWAGEYLADWLVRGIRFMNALLFKEGPAIESNPDPMAQFSTALLNFSNVGLLNGHFTSEEAKGCFLKAVPIMERYYHEKDPFKRAALSGDIVEIARPLWKHTTYAKLEELIRHLLQAGLISPDAIPSGGKNGQPIVVAIESEEEPDESSSSAEARRAATMQNLASERKPNKETPDPVGKKPKDPSQGKGKSKKKSSETKTGDTADSSESGCPEAESPDKDDAHSGDKSSASSSSPDSKNSPEERDSKDGDASHAGEDDGGDEKDDAPVNSPDDESPHGNTSDTNSTDANAGDSKGSPAASSSSEASTEEGTHTDGKTPKESAATPIEDDLVISDQDVETIREDLARAAQELSAAHEAEEEDAQVDLNLPVDGGYHNLCHGRTCKNLKVKLSPSQVDSLSSEYDRVVAQMQGGIIYLSRMLQRALLPRTEDKEYRPNGKLEISRMSSGRATSRVFSRRRTPADRSDTHVMLLIDQSGSMSSFSKMARAREAAIGICEALDKVHVPVSVVGFTADCGADAVHYHYMNGTNTRTTRIRLLTADAMADNFDGYSIRYAAEYLKKVKAEHKILIVISDGNPACHAYSGYRNVTGVQDVQSAVRDASKIATVFGILIGNGSTDYHRQMYGKNFVPCPNVQDLFPSLARMITTELRKW